MAERPTTYSIDRKLASGKHANLYQAGTFAIKFPRQARDDDGITYVHEIDLLTRLKHPLLLQLVDLTLTEHRTGLVLPLYPGTTLDYDPSAVTTLRWLSEIEAALAFLENFSLIHLDIRRSNILLTQLGEEGSIIIADFGVYSYFDSLHEVIPDLNLGCDYPPELRPRHDLSGDIPRIDYGLRSDLDPTKIHSWFLGMLLISFVMKRNTGYLNERDTSWVYQDDIRLYFGSQSIDILKHFHAWVDPNPAARSGIVHIDVPTRDPCPIEIEPLIPSLVDQLWGYWSSSIKNRLIARTQTILTKTIKETDSPDKHFIRVLVALIIARKVALGYINQPIIKPLLALFPETKITAHHLRAQERTTLRRLKGNI